MDPVFERTSVRRWENKPVEPEKTEQILKAAMASPSAMNSRPWQFYVIENEEVKKQLAMISPYSHFAADAPLMIALTCDKNNCCSDYDAIDMGICIENVLLEAVQQGLGAVCLGVAPLKERMDAMAEILKLPENEEAYALIPMGYPAKKPEFKEHYEPERVHWIR